ncbi:hypothetical protein [Mycoplasmoides alvi]|uniref:hypothetical protein n=1 Tax=Mycoplasmoides alvi TaxID=78580 RepID=UPI00051AB1F1|nr:hypothetical protein [Mycoplasmoides alvi]
MNNKESKDLLKLKKYFLFMFSWFIIFITFFLIGFFAIIVIAFIHKNETNKDVLLYSFIFYLIVTFLMIAIYFAIGSKVAKFLNKNPVAVVIYEKNELLKNPFNLIKEIKKINCSYHDLKNGASVQDIKIKYFSSSSKDLK